MSDKPQISPEQLVKFLRDSAKLLARCEEHNAAHYFANLAGYLAGGGRISDPDDVYGDIGDAELGRIHGV